MNTYLKNYIKANNVKLIDIETTLDNEMLETLINNCNNKDEDYIKNELYKDKGYNKLVPFISKFFTKDYDLYKQIRSEPLRERTEIYDVDNIQDKLDNIIKNVYPKIKDNIVVIQMMYLILTNFNNISAKIFKKELYSAGSLYYKIDKDYTNLKMLDYNTFSKIYKAMLNNVKFDMECNNINNSNLTSVFNYAYDNDTDEYVKQMYNYIWIMVSRLHKQSLEYRNLTLSLSFFNKTQELDNNKDRNYCVLSTTILNSNYYDDVIIPRFNMLLSDCDLPLIFDRKVYNYNSYVYGIDVKSKYYLYSNLCNLNTLYKDNGYSSVYHLAMKTYKSIYDDTDISYGIEISPFYRALIKNLIKDELEFNEKVLKRVINMLYFMDIDEIPYRIKKDNAVSVSRYIDIGQDVQHILNKQTMEELTKNNSLVTLETSCVITSRKMIKDIDKYKILKVETTVKLNDFTKKIYNKEFLKLNKNFNCVFYWASNAFDDTFYNLDFYTTIETKEIVEKVLNRCISNILNNVDVCPYTKKVVKENFDNSMKKGYHSKKYLGVLYNLDDINDSEDNPETFGFEWEVELQHGIYNNGYTVDDLILEINNILPKVFYYERDGSLSDYRGVELVSRPMTLSFLAKHKQEFNKVGELINSKCLSNNNNCGTHIHINKNAFKYDTALDITGLLVASNTELYKRFMNRQFNQYAEISNILSSNVFIKSDLKNFDIEECFEDSRYSAINTTNSNTIEFRLPAGTTTWSSVVSYIYFNLALVRLSNEIDYDNFKNKIYTIKDLFATMENEQLYDMFISYANRKERYNGNEVLLEVVEG